MEWGSGCGVAASSRTSASLGFWFSWRCVYELKGLGHVFTKMCKLLWKFVQMKETKEAAFRIRETCFALLYLFVLLGFFAFHHISEVAIQRL